MTKYNRIISKGYLEDAIKDNEDTLQNLRKLEKKRKVKILLLDI